MAAMEGETELTAEQVLSNIDTRMDRSLEAFNRDLTQLRTGRGHAFVDREPVRGLLRLPRLL